MSAFKKTIPAHQAEISSGFRTGFGRTRTKENTLVAAPCWAPASRYYYTSSSGGQSENLYHDLKTRASAIYRLVLGLN